MSNPFAHTHDGRYSPELSFLLAIIRSIILNPDQNADGNHRVDVEKKDDSCSGGYISTPEGMDEHRFEALARFHKVCLIVAAYDARYSCLSPGLSERFKRIRHQQIARTFRNIQETKRIVQRLQEVSIDVIPYKGSLILQNYYRHRQLRESADIDLLIHKKDLRRLVNVFSNDGYTIKDIEKKRSRIGEEETLLTHFETIGYYNEVSLLGKGLAVDVHWELSRNSYQLNYPVTDLFSRSVAGDFYHTPIRLPSKEDQFVMMVHHHGGREHWQKIKNVVDLYFALLAVNGKIDTGKTASLLQQIGLMDALQKGVFLLSQIGLGDLRSDLIDTCRLHYHQSSERALTRYSRIVKSCWEYAEDWYGMKGSMRAFLRYHRMLLFHSGGTFRKRTYVKLLLQTYLLPNDYETPRIITFPSRFRVLNLVSKIVTYLLFRIRLRKREAEE